MFASIEHASKVLAEHSYLADDGLATSLFLALRMQKPLFLEGQPGVGKTEIAKVLAVAFDTPLIRLQCYEGIDVHQAVYEWSYQRQLLAIQASKTASNETALDDIFNERFLLKRPLLQAIDPAHEAPPVLLIDELDRADEELESFLLELLGEFQITVPELGTLKARHRPITVITSNRTREIHDALKRRCLYHWIDYPSAERELAIVRRKVPGISERLTRQVVAFVQAVREEEDLYKLPGIAETLDWAAALGHLAAERLDPQLIRRTLGFVLKYQDDVDQLKGPATEALLEKAVGA